MNNKWIVTTGILLSVLLSACSKEPQQALGTLEWDRINGRAVASETIVAIHAKEGDQVEAGQLLLEIDNSLQQAHVKKLTAAVEYARWKLRELESGYRDEEIASARAKLDAKTVARKNAESNYLRQKSLRKNNLNSQRQLDDAMQRYEQASGDEEIAWQQLKELKAGFRVEQVEQAKAKFEEQQAELEYQQQLLLRYSIVAQRAGQLDSLPYKLGDKPPANAVLTTVLAGEKPWARVYLPETWLSSVKVGSTLQVKVDGKQEPIEGSIRVISSVPSFTPYYALSEGDRSRLMYIAEIDLLDEKALTLPLGVPVQVLR